MPCWASPARPSAAQIDATSGSNRLSDRNNVKIGTTMPLPSMIAARPGPPPPSSPAVQMPKLMMIGTRIRPNNPMSVRGLRSIQRTSEPN